MEILTDTGLNLPATYTEDQFFEAGRLLAKIEHGMQWAMGDWYNQIPWGDKPAACEKAGLSYKTANQCGWIANQYKLPTRVGNLSFKHHETVAKLPVEVRADLLDKAAEYEWPVSRLTKERDRMLGKPEKIKLPDFDAKVEQALDSLPPGVTKKTRRVVEELFASLKHRFQVEVEAEVKKRLKGEYEHIEQLRKELEDKRGEVSAIRSGLTALLTQDEFNLIRGCLHPDRQPPELQERFAKAFDSFNRLRPTIDAQMPLSVAKDRGWETAHPRYKPTNA